MRGRGLEGIDRAGASHHTFKGGPGNGGGHRRNNTREGEESVPIIPDITNGLEDREDHPARLKNHRATVEKGRSRIGGRKKL